WMVGGCGGGLRPRGGPADPNLVPRIDNLICTITVSVTYAVGSVGGNLDLRATSTVTDLGWYVVTAAIDGPVVSQLPHNGDYRDVTKCVVGCFDAVASYSMQPYFSQDVPRSVQLVYRSSQAHPMGFVQVDATDTNSVTPVLMSILLKRSDGTFVTFTNGSTELYYRWAAGANRLAAQFDASNLATGP